MIARLSGVVEEKGDGWLVVDVQGVGYRVHVSSIALARLPPAGERIKLRVQTVVREDALDLFGFASEEEEELFGLLTTVSHVGPRVAIGILSGIEPGELAEALRAGNVGRLKSIRGVGKKIAERLVVELREKVSVRRGASATVTPLRPAGVAGDLVSALVNLGYKPAQAERAAEMARLKLGDGAQLESLLREALQAVR